MCTYVLWPWILRTVFLLFTLLWVKYIQQKNNVVLLQALTERHRKHWDAPGTFWITQALCKCKICENHPKFQSKISCLKSSNLKIVTLERRKKPSLWWPYMHKRQCCGHILYMYWIKASYKEANINKNTFILHVLTALRLIWHNAVYNTLKLTRNSEVNLLI